jgi:ribosomal protein L32
MSKQKVEMIEKAEKAVIARASRIAYERSNNLDDSEVQSMLYRLCKDYIILGARMMEEELMKLGYYEGVNLSLAYCDDCGHEELAMDVCPKCGSRNLTKIDRMNGYLSYSRVKGDTRLNDAKMEEIAERKSM